MEFLRRYGFYFLFAGVVIDFLTPYILVFFYPQFNQMTTVISVFGDVSSPVRKAFLIWSVISGCLYVLALPAVYQTFVTVSRLLTLLLTAAIGFYGVFDCIFSGLFSLDMNGSSGDFSTWIHNMGSGIGYTGFLLLPLIVFLIHRAMGNNQFSQLFLGLAIISFLVAGGYGLARIPELNRLPLLNQLGFWQRLSFFFNYLPIGILSILQIKS